MDHDERETVPILVRPRDDDDHGDSGTVSDRAERLSLTFVPMMDRRSGIITAALHSFKQHGD